MHYHPAGSGRFLLRLDPGDEIITSLRQFVTDAEVKSGWISGIGSTSMVSLGFLDPETNEYVKRKFDEPMEVGQLSGTITVEAEDGRPFIHLHGTFAPRELIAYTGHVHEARVGVVMEILVTAFEETFERHTVPDRPFPWLVLPGEQVPDGDDTAS